MSEPIKHCWYSAKADEVLRNFIIDRPKLRHFYTINGVEQCVTVATEDKIPPNWDDAIYLGEGTFHHNERI